MRTGVRREDGAVAVVSAAAQPDAADSHDAGRAVRSAEDTGDGAEAPHARLTFSLHPRPGGWKPFLVTRWFDVEGMSLAAQGDPVLVCLSPNPIDVPVEVRIEAARTDPQQIVAVQRSLFGAD